MQTKKLIPLCILILALSSTSLASEASDIDIIEFIIENNPRVKIARELRTHPLKDVRVEGKASAYMGTVGDATDKGSIGVVVSIPLLDVREKLERQKVVADTIEAIKTKAIATLEDYRIASTNIKNLLIKIQARKEYLAWMKKRVEAGIEYQTTYLKTEYDLMELEEALAKADVKLNIHKNKLLLLVQPEARKKLLSMLKEE